PRTERSICWASSKIPNRRSEQANWRHRWQVSNTWITIFKSNTSSHRTEEGPRRPTGPLVRPRSFFQNLSGPLHIASLGWSRQPSYSLPTPRRKNTASCLAPPQEIQNIPVSGSHPLHERIHRSICPSSSLTPPHKRA